MTLETFPKYVLSQTEFDSLVESWKALGYECSETNHYEYSEVVVANKGTSIAEYFGYQKTTGYGIEYERFYLAEHGFVEGVPDDPTIEVEPEFPLEFPVSEKDHYKSGWRAAGLKWREVWHSGEYELIVMDPSRSLSLAIYAKHGAEMMASYIDTTYGYNVPDEEATFVDIIRGIT